MGIWLQVCITLNLPHVRLPNKLVRWSLFPVYRGGDSDSGGGKLSDLAVVKVELSLAQILLEFRCTCFKDCQVFFQLWPVSLAAGSPDFSRRYFSGWFLQLLLKVQEQVSFVLHLENCPPLGCHMWISGGVAKAQAPCMLGCHLPEEVVVHLKSFCLSSRASYPLWYTWWHIILHHGNKLKSVQISAVIKWFEQQIISFNWC